MSHIKNEAVVVCVDREIDHLPVPERGLGKSSSTGSGEPSETECSNLELVNPSRSPTDYPLMPIRRIPRLRMSRCGANVTRAGGKAGVLKQWA